MKIQFKHTITMLAALLPLTTLACSKDKAQKSDADKASSAEPKGKSAESKASASASGPSAHVHLAKNCDVAAYVDMAKLSEAAPIKKHLVPAWEKALANKPKDDSQQKMRAAMKDVGFNDPVKDLSGAAVCVTNVRVRTAKTPTTRSSWLAHSRRTRSFRPCSSTARRKRSSRRSKSRAPRR